MNEAVKGHLLAIFTAICWGTTFISTKILLVDFSPLEILVTRFVIGLTVLYMIRPHVLKLRHEEHRLYLVVAALSGITLYYLMENIALTYTYASNVGIITATAPFFAAILARFTLKNSHLSGPFFIGFIVSMIGVVLISTEGGGLNFNPKGDMLALGAAVLSAVYIVVLKKSVRSAMI
ncbi:DMT family transporter [Megamonas sp.]